MTLPDTFINHASPADMYEEAGLNAPQIADPIRKLIGVG